MSGPELGQQIWRPNPKQAALAVLGVLAVAAGLLLTLPKDRARPLRPTTVSRPSEAASGTPGTVGTAPAPGSAAPVSQTPTSVSRAAGPAAMPSRPVEGRFVYKRTLESGGETTEGEASWFVRHLDTEVFEQASAQGRDAEPDEKSSRQTVRWSAAGVFRAAMQFPDVDFPGQEDASPRRCSFEPPLLTMPLPLEVGLRWETASACGEGSQRTTEELSGQVVRVERVAIAGVEFDTFVMELFSGSGQRGQFWFTEESTQWFAPQLGVFVRSKEVHRETELNSAFENEMTWELVTWPGGPPA